MTEAATSSQPTAIDVAPLPPLRSAEDILADIAALEAQQARPIREFALSGQRDTDALARITRINDQIATLRAELSRAP